MRSWLILGILFFSAVGWSQDEDSVERSQSLRMVDISIKKIKRPVSTPMMLRQDFDIVMAEDVGELLMRFPGVTMKSYGGLGGLKTVSVRGLGSTHTALVVDGVRQINNQTGQVNLGQIDPSFIESATLYTGSDVFTLAPISAHITGNALIVNTSPFQMSSRKLSAKAHVQYGSFGQLSGNGMVKYGKEKFTVSGYGKYRQAHGRYPFSVSNGATFEAGDRLNNQYQDAQFGGMIGVKPNKNVVIRLGYKGMLIDQELPGAVIFYNSTADETLATTNHQLQLLVEGYPTKRLSFRWYAHGSMGTLRYQDPTFLNNQGGIDDQYETKNAHGGIIANYRLKKFNFYGGSEEQVAHLKSNDTTFATPLRFSNNALLGGMYSAKKFHVKVQLATIYVHETVQNGEAAENKFEFTPYAHVSSRELGSKQWVIGAFYRRSFRMPTFNELYYNSIGNTLLDPEEAHQFSGRISVKPIDGKFQINVHLSGYYNRVENKIVATPNKNLFVWTILNLDKVEHYGGDINVTGRWRLSDDWSAGFVANYTYQRSLDITDSEGETYRHQVAYIPEHLGNLSVDVRYKRTGLTINNFGNSLRYSLNQNIPENEVGGFVVADVGLYHQFVFEKGHELIVRGSVKNIWNSSYEFIRSYVMPGRNFLISLSYAFN